MAQLTYYDIINEGVKWMATGLLGVLWWDVRKVHGLKEMILGEVDKKIAEHSDKTIEWRHVRDKEVSSCIKELSKDMVERFDRLNAQLKTEFLSKSDHVIRCSQQVAQSQLQNERDNARLKEEIWSRIDEKSKEIIAAVKNGRD